MDGIKAIFKDVSGIEEIHLTVEYIEELFRNMTDEDCQFLGLNPLFCRPEWLICSVLPPPSMRPSVKQDKSQRMDDDLTHKLVDIIKSNNTLKQKIEANAKSVIEDLMKYNIMWLHLLTMIYRNTQSVHRSGRSLKSISQRLKGKDE